jgi:hypothetical protein
MSRRIRKRQLVIVVPGVKYIHSDLNLLQRLILFIYHFTHTINPPYNYPKRWKHKFDRGNRAVLWLKWNRGITPLSKWIGVMKLKKKIKENKDKYDVIRIVGISMGGEIALEAARFFDDGVIKKIILVCSPNQKNHITLKRTKVINMYSKYDLIAKFGILIFAPFHGGKKLYGNTVRNIKIPKFSHGKFCRDETINSGNWKGKTVTQVINRFLMGAVPKF